MKSRARYPAVKRTAARKAVVLLSGGLDSATTLYYAISKGFIPICLTFDYGQRHSRELKSARMVAASAGCRCEVLTLPLPWKGSSLLDARVAIPRASYRRLRAGSRREIPSTYVPGRNLLFVSYALSCAEAVGASSIFIGANAIDYSGYPDCRPQFYRALQQAVRVGTRSGVAGRPIRIVAPLIRMTKAQIIRLGARLGVPFALTWSCYRGGRVPCGKCDSCFLRKRGFAAAGMVDPLCLKGKDIRS